MSSQDSRNVVLICLDTARNDFFREHATRVQSRTDVRFSRVKSGNCWSGPSHASMFIGGTPSEHGLHSHDMSFETVDPETVVTDDLPGYDTLGVSANVYASSVFGFDRFFDDFVDINRLSVFNDGIDVADWRRENDPSDGIRKYVEFLRNAVAHDRPLASIANGIGDAAHSVFPSFGIPSPLDDSARLIQKKTDQLVSDAQEPFFLFANFMDNHAPRAPRLVYDNSIHDLPVDWRPNLDIWEINTTDDPSEYESTFRKLRELVQAEMDYLDRKVAEYVDFLQRVTTRETTIIITADHGENLGYPQEDFQYLHTSSLSESLVDVPFEIVNPPPGYDEVESELFSLTRLPALITEFASGNAPSLFKDVVRAEVIGIPSLRRDTLDPDEMDFLDRMIRCVHFEDKKFEWDTRGKTRELHVDPREPSSQSVIQTDVNLPEFCYEQFDENITEFKQRAATEDTQMRETVSEEVLQQLDDLGYN